jgi:hypothetical protein
MISIEFLETEWDALVTANDSGQPIVMQELLELSFTKDFTGATGRVFESFELLDWIGPNEISDDITVEEATDWTLTCFNDSQRRYSGANSSVNA